MLITDEKLKMLESISKINLTDTEKENALGFFNFFIGKFDVLENIEIENIDPLVTVFPVCNIMREDISYKIISRETLFENAVEQNDGYFVVPKILE